MSPNDTRRFCHNCRFIGPGPRQPPRDPWSPPGPAKYSFCWAAPPNGAKGREPGKTSSHLPGCRLWEWDGKIQK